jgi:membrane protein
MNWHRLTQFDYHPTHWAAAVAKVVGRAWHRSQNRHSAVYVGGVSFYALLAVFPAFALLIGAYSLLFTPQEAEAQAVAFAHMMPPGPERLLQNELGRLALDSMHVISLQSVLAVLIGLYASLRGVKALLAGLQFIHDEERPRGFVGFNLLALCVAIGGFSLMALISATFLAVRVMASTFDVKPFSGIYWLFSEWTWASIGLVLGLTLVYRFAMSSRPVIWSASIIGGVTAAALSLLASWGCAFYVEQVAHLGATYGSIAAVVVFLIWLSWNVNAVFYAGALVTEIEMMVGKRPVLQLGDLRRAKAKLASQR